VIATAFWFGPEERRLFGWLHQPADAPRGGIVLCSPVGYEHPLAYRTYVALADALAAAGFLVLRFDYDGTGDSAGDDYEPGRVAAWLTSIDRAIDFLRPLTDTLAVVGMRLGATLAATAVARRDDVDLAVLWDPCISGRAFIRESKMLHIVGVGVDEQPIDDGAFEAAGHVFTRETVEELSAISLTDIDSAIAREVLVLTRPDRAFNNKTRAHLDATNVITWGEAVGQAELLDELELLDDKIPTEAVAHIVSWLTWLTERLPAPPTEPRALPELPTTAVLRHDARGDVTECPVRLGPLGLFGIMAERSDRPVGPTIICLNYGTAHHIGPGRLWIDLARAWAAEGLRVLRLDLSGIGDSPVRPGQRAGLANAPEAFDDVLDVLRDLNAADPHDAVLVGVCSGAYLSIDVAALHGVRGVYAINANLRYEPPDLLASTGDANRALPPSRGSIRRLSASGIGDRVKDNLPPLAWHVLDRAGVHPTPTHAVERLVDQGVDTFLGYGTDNLLTMLVERSKYSLRTLARKPNFHLEIVDGLDHLLMLRRHRARMAEALTANIVTKYAPSASRHTDVPDSPDSVDTRNRASWALPSIASWFGVSTGWSDEGEPIALAAVGPHVHDQPLLDVGVGGGRTTPFLKLMSADYVAVDYTPEMVDAFRARHPNDTIHLGDARDLAAFADEQFALVYFSLNGIDAVDHDDRASVLASFFRVLKPGGYALFSTLNKTGPAARGGPWTRRSSSAAPAPYRVARFIGQLPFKMPLYVAGYRNWFHNRSLHVDHGDWALRSLSGHEYRLVVHFTTLAAQYDGLRAAGLEPVATYGDHGRALEPSDDLHETNWFHVIARRPERS